LFCQLWEGFCRSSALAAYDREAPVRTTAEMFEEAPQVSADDHGEHPSD